MNISKLFGRRRPKAFPTLSPGQSAMHADIASSGEVSAPTYPEQVAPLTRDASARYFAAFQRPHIDQDRWMIIAALTSLCAVFEGLALWQLIPLKQPVPFFVASDAASGAVFKDDRVAKVFKPEDANKTYFLRQWVALFLTIKPNPADTITVDIPKAASWTSGAAAQQIDEYTTKTDPIAKRIADTKGLTREVLVNSTTYSLDGKQAYLLITLTERVNGKVPEGGVTTKLLTINFVLAPDRLKPEDLDDNPLGIKIDYFTLTPYYGPGNAGTAAAAGAK
ncbi:VirB8/TrbF family protein [Achromobacter aloeverae]